jgi:hypothetical protein
MVLGIHHPGQEYVEYANFTADDVQLHNQLLSEYNNLSSAAKQSLATALPNASNYFRACLVGL